MRKAIVAKPIIEQRSALKFRRTLPFVHISYLNA
jgi:hypothetical protein